MQRGWELGGEGVAVSQVPDIGSCRESRRARSRSLVATRFSSAACSSTMADDSCCCTTALEGILSPSMCCDAGTLVLYASAAFFHLALSHSNFGSSCWASLKDPACDARAAAGQWSTVRRMPKPPYGDGEGSLQAGLCWQGPVLIMQDRRQTPVHLRIKIPEVALP